MVTFVITALGVGWCVKGPGKQAMIAGGMITFVITDAWAEIIRKL